MILSRNLQNVNGLDQDPWDGWEVCTGDELRKNYPDLWKEILKIENLKDEKALKESYALQKEGTGEFTHVYSNEDDTKIILAVYGERKKHPLGLRGYEYEFNLPFNLIKLETRKIQRGDIGELVTSINL